MAATHVQFLGGAAPSVGSAHTTTVLSPSSKTVTLGDVIIAGFTSYGDVTPTGVTDNLGNTYVHAERTVHSNGVVADLWYAPVTHAGSITTVTISHPSSDYTMLLASEFAGVGALNAAGGGLTGVSATATWADNKTIPASGLAVGVVAESDGQHTHTAGAESGSPSTTILKSGQIDAGADSFTLSLCYALAGASAVTSFTGTTGMSATVSWAGAGGLFNPSGEEPGEEPATVLPNFLPFFWAYPASATPTQQTPTQNIVSFTSSQTISAFMTLLADESVDVIEMAAGTYHFPYTVININRTRLVVVRPAAGATVILSGSVSGRDPQFGFGFDGIAGNITMQGLIFDGYILGQQGIIQALDCHDITLNDMLVRNSRCNPEFSPPNSSIAIYITSTPTVFVTNFTANRWTVEATDRQMSALQVYGGNNVTALDWIVSNACYAVYASGSGRGPLTNFILDGWTIINTGNPVWGFENISVAAEYSTGEVSNMHATASGGLAIVGTPQLIDGGGNTWA